MTNEYQLMINDIESDIRNINARIQRLGDTIPHLTGKDIEVTYRKIKIYNSMIDDLIYTQSQIRAYIN